MEREEGSGGSDEDVDDMVIGWFMTFVVSTDEKSNDRMMWARPIPEREGNRVNRDRVYH